MGFNSGFKGVTCSRYTAG